ncbi:MAG: caspase family protein [Deltaproteobacteria bacterium]|nr:caspase family protein [Deltaproteobacteria bacterium]
MSCTRRWAALAARGPRAGQRAGRRGPGGARTAGLRDRDRGGQGSSCTRRWAAAAALGLWLLAGACGTTRPKGGLEPLEGLSSAQVEAALQPRRLALVVGVDRFADPRWPELKHPRADARALAGLLQDPAAGRFDAVELLDSESGTGLVALSAALDRLAGLNRSERDVVLVYFSTHGTLARGPDGHLARYLVLSDTDQDRIGRTGLRVRDLVARFEALPSARKVLVLASCHSGAGKSALPGPLARELGSTKGAFFVRPLEEISQASMVLTACAWGETAREDDELGHDIYTHFLLEALAGEDTDGDGAITASEAHAHAMARTYYYTRGRQRPQVESRVSGADPIVLSGYRQRRGDPVLFSFASDLSGLEIEVDGRPKGALPARLVVEPGSHRVVLRAAGRGAVIVDDEVELDAGEQLAVESLLERELPDWHLQAQAGYQRFFDAGVRRELVQPLAVFGISASRLRFPIEMMEVGLDLGLAGASQGMEVGGRAFSQQIFQISYGLKIMFHAAWGPVDFLAGPRLAGIHLLRSGISGTDESQGFANFSPGLVGELRWRIWSGLTLGLDLRLHFLSIHTLAGARDTGYLDLMLGLGWAL